MHSCQPSQKPTKKIKFYFIPESHSWNGIQLHCSNGSKTIYYTYVLIVTELYNIRLTTVSNSVPGQSQSIFSTLIDLPMAIPFYYNFYKNVSHAFGMVDSYNHWLTLRAVLHVNSHSQFHEIGIGLN